MPIAKKEKAEKNDSTQVKEEKMTTRARGKQRVQSDGEEDGDNDGVAGVNDPDEDAQGEEEEQEEEEEVRVSKRQRVNGEGDSRASSVHEQDIPRTRIKTLPRDADGYLLPYSQLECDIYSISDIFQARSCAYS